VLGAHLTQCGQRRDLPELPPYKWHLDPSSRLVTTYVGRKLGAAVLLLEKGELGHHITQCGRGRGLPTCQVSSWFNLFYLHRLAFTVAGPTAWNSLPDYLRDPSL